MARGWCGRRAAVLWLMTYHLNIGRKLANLPALKQRLAATRIA